MTCQSGIPNLGLLRAYNWHPGASLRQAGHICEMATIRKLIRSRADFQPIIYPFPIFASGNCNRGTPMRRNLCQFSSCFLKVSSLFHGASSRWFRSTYSGQECAFIRFIVIISSTLRALSLCGTFANLKTRKACRILERYVDFGPFRILNIVDRSFRYSSFQSISIQVAEVARLRGRVISETRPDASPRLIGLSHSLSLSRAREVDCGS